MADEFFRGVVICGVCVAVVMVLVGVCFIAACVAGLCCAYGYEVCIFSSGVVGDVIRVCVLYC